MALMGYTALSVLRQTTDSTPARSAARMTLSLPPTLVCTACIGKNSQLGTCLRAAAWKTCRPRGPHPRRYAGRERHPRGTSAAVRQLASHSVLLGLVAAEDADFLDVGCQKPTDHRRTERTRTSRHQDGTTHALLTSSTVKCSSHVEVLTLR